MRRRLDTELVRRGLAPTVDEAASLIEHRRVLVEGAPADKPQRQVSPGESISLARNRTRFVGRGGDKLRGALDRFGLELIGHRVLDAGASTGGFTDVALQDGAVDVVAVDVGRGQLHEKLRQDSRVTVMDRTNIRLVGPAELGAFDTIVGDLSFISLSAVMANLVACTKPGGQLVLLVKPQFEANRDEAGHNGGVIVAPQTWRSVLERTVTSGVSNGVEVVAMCPSSIRGADGNVEFFVHFSKSDDMAGGPEGAGGAHGTAVAEMVDAVVAEATRIVGSR